MIVMLVKECKYDPIKDLKPVDENGYLDLASAYVNKTVPADIVTQDTDFNGIEDPSSIVGKPSDVFDAIRMQDAIEKRAAAVNKSADQAAEDVYNGA